MKTPGLHLGLLATFLATLLAAPSPARAWNGSGHRLSASIAWDQLTPRTRQVVGRLLAAHQDAERLAAPGRSYAGLDGDWARFVEASTWADDIRHDPRYEREKEGKASLGQRLPVPDFAAHQDWHYENQPLTPVAKGRKKTAEDGQISARIRQLQEILGRRQSGQQEQAYALVWLLHLVGDIHQPLHVVSRYDPGGKGDGGGNEQQVLDLGGKRPQANLHAYWDNLPAPAGLRGAHLLQTARELQEEVPAGSVRFGSVQGWKGESLRLARSAVYPREATTLLVLEDDYRERARAIARRRIAEAGYRLGHLLNQALGK